jgi:membrane protease YdiL (CAAX protease family)
MTMRLRLALWLAAVALLATLAYASRATEGRPPRDLLYKYDTAIGSLVGYVFIVAVVILPLAWGHFELLALRRPRSWGRAIGQAIGLLFLVLIGGNILDHYLHAGREQGYTPPSWEPDKAKQYAANFVVVALVAPIVEELLFRGLGYSLLEPLGRFPAIVAVGLTFAAVHGLLAGFVVLALFGAVLAWLRSRTDSVIPGMLVHASYNAVALILAVAG